jgi:hypothetical protein
VNQFLSASAARRYFASQEEHIMTEQKADIFSSTGSHRRWVGEGVVGGRVAAEHGLEQRSLDQRGVDQNGTRLPLREAARPWPGRPTSSNARHAAITKNLSHFTNYKSWADKARSDWKKDPTE